MKKILLYIATLIFALSAYYFTFSSFYETWVPYYYEDYLSYIFLSGIFFILIIPVAGFAAFKLWKNNFEYNGIYTYLNLAFKLHLVVIALLALVYGYMVATGIFFNEPGTYMVVPSNG